MKTVSSITGTELTWTIVVASALLLLFAILIIFVASVGVAICVFISTVAIEEAKEWRRKRSEAKTSKP